MILAVVVDALLIERLRPRLQRNVFRLHIRGEVQTVLHERRRHPEALEIDMAVGQASRRRLQIHLAVGQPRHVFHRGRIPLRQQRGASREKRKYQAQQFLHSSSREYTAAVYGPKWYKREVRLKALLVVSAVAAASAISAQTVVRTTALPTPDQVLSTFGSYVEALRVQTGIPGMVAAII